MKKAGEIIKIVYLTPFLALGWLGGASYKLLRLAVAALVEGFEAGYS